MKVRTHFVTNRNILPGANKKAGNCASRGCSHASPYVAPGQGKQFTRENGSAWHVAHADCFQKMENRRQGALARRSKVTVTVDLDASQAGSQAAPEVAARP